MQKYRTEALVIGVHNWGEADKLVTFFTKERGKVRGTAFGCRRAKSPLAAGMQMFQHVDVELSEGQRLDTVRQCSILRHYKRLDSELSVIAYGAFVAELISEMMPEHEPEPDLFALLLKIFPAFERRNPRIAALAAAYQLLEYSGMQLSYGYCVHCGREIEEDTVFSVREGGALCGDCAVPDGMPYSGALRRMILEIRNFDWEADSRMQLKKAELLQAEQLLMEHIQTLLGHPLKSLGFLAQL